jgi:hypothetical protein
MTSYTCCNSTSGKEQHKNVKCCTPDSLALEARHVLGADLACSELAAHLIVNSVHRLTALQEAVEAVNQVREAPNDVLQGLTKKG